MKAYAHAFVPTPMGSVAMGDAADVSERTWADEQPTLTPFNFLLLLAHADALGWWQYLHWRFPLALGWGEGAPPTPLPVYIDPERWVPEYLKANENTFQLVVATPTLDWHWVAPGGVLVLVDVDDVPGLDTAFVAVQRVPGAVVGIGYLGTPVPLDGARRRVPAPSRRDRARER